MKKDSLFQLATFLFILVIIPLTVVLLRRETELPKEAAEEKTIAAPERPTLSLTDEDIKTLTLFPQPGKVGWVVSNEPSGNHFSTGDIHAGYWEGSVYYGVIQFDLSPIPAGAKILSAQTALVGKSRSRIGEKGLWTLNLLEASVDSDFSNLNFAQVKKAQVLTQILPTLKNSDLDIYKENSFIFSEKQLPFIEKRLTSTQKITFRLDGPSPNGYPFNLFTWESGFGEGSFKIKPVLEIFYTTQR